MSSSLSARLRQWLQAAAIGAQLAAWRKTGDASRYFSLHLDLGPYHGHWLEYLNDANPCFCYQAQVARREFRLGLGCAWQQGEQGPGRLLRLDTALRSCRANWLGSHPADASIGFAFHEDSPAPPANAQLSVPTLWLEARDGQARAIFSSRLENFEHDREKLLDALQPLPQAAPPAPAPPQLQPGDPLAWERRVATALRAIHDGQLQKLVLAREIQVSAATPLAPQKILAQLLLQQCDGLIYAQREPGFCFLGATPETLVSLRCGKIGADALAGTAWQDSPELESDKNCREQQYVVEAVSAALAPHCRANSLHSQAREKHRAGQLTHWRSRIVGQALAGTSLLQLADALHPSPAVGGFPPLAAWQWLRTAGEERPGWYSGGIGRISGNGDGEIWVALRSALIDGKLARLQAGAGIVADSDAGIEYQETAAKLGSMLNALLAPTPPDPQAPPPRP